MKRFLKWAGIVVIVFLVLVGGFAAFIAFGGLPKYDVKIVDLVVDRSPARVAHGRELATHLCMMCHRNPLTGKLTGIKLPDLPEIFGVAYSKNITNDKVHGIGAWKDGQIAWLLRTGIHPMTGSYVPPWMPKFPRMSDYDLQSIIAFLRSDDHMVEASDNINKVSEPTFFAKFLCRVAFKPFEYPSQPIPHPDTTNTVAYGKYLALNVHGCYECHSKDFASNDENVPEKSEGFFGGGQELLDASGLKPHTANLTPDKTFGTGRYTRDQFIQILSTGFRPNGTPLRYPMVNFRSLGPYALGSLYDYLQTVPAIHQQVIPVTPAGPWKDKGAELFDKYACTSCHSKTGVGIASLKLANAKYPDDSVLTDVIKHQYKYNQDSYMPIFEGHISDGDLHELAVHVRELCKD